MNIKAGALAFAAPLLLMGAACAHPAGAGGHYSGHDRYKPEPRHVYGHASYGRHHSGINRFGQSHKEEIHLKREAGRACRAAIYRKASYLGFRDVDIERGRYVHQFRPYGFEVKFREVEFEGRRWEIERPVTCIVRRGRVMDVKNIPEPRHHHRHGRKHFY